MYSISIVSKSNIHSIRQFSSIKNINKIHSKGLGLFGALGNNSLEDRESFEEVEWNESNGNPVKNSAGWGHSLILTQEGRVAAYGRPYDFKNLLRLNTMYSFNKKIGRWFANSSNSSVFGKEAHGFYDKPYFFNIDNVTDISTSAALSLFLRNNTVYALGQNHLAQCGFAPSLGNNFFQPVQVKNVPNSIAIATGIQHGMALSSYGDIFAWGKAENGRLGFSGSEKFSLSERVPLFDEDDKKYTAIKICAGFAFSAALCEDGSFFLWGKNMSLDIKKEVQNIIIREDQLVPRRIMLPDDRKVVDMYASGFQLVLKADDNTLWVIGMAEQDRSSYTEPIQIFNDFLPLDQKENIDKENPESYSNIPVIVEKDWKIFSAYDRITIFTNNEYFNALKLAYNLETPNTKHFQIIIHGNEAYLLPFDANQVNADDVLDYNASWKHSLLLTK